jgi:hypothetical protein
MRPRLRDSLSLNTTAPNRLIVQPCGVSTGQCRDRKKENNLQQSTEPRRERERELRQHWKTKHGQIQLLSYFWEIRPRKTPLQAGESVIDAILNSEFGIQPTPESVPQSDELAAVTLSNTAAADV